MAPPRVSAMTSLILARMLCRCVGSSVGEAGDLPAHDVTQAADHAGDQRHDEQHADDARHAQPIEPRDERAQEERDEGGQHQRHEHGLPQIECGANDGEADQPHCKERRYRPIALGRSRPRSPLRRAARATASGRGSPCARRAAVPNHRPHNTLPSVSSREQVACHAGSAAASRCGAAATRICVGVTQFLRRRRRRQRLPRAGTTFAGSGHERRHRQSRQSRGDCAL